MRSQFENGFSALTAWIFNHRLLTLLALLLVIGGFLSGMPKLTVDTSTEGFLHAEDPTLIAYNNFRNQFGQDDVVMIALKPDSVFELGFLRKLQELHQALEEKVPYLDEVTSLVNARNTHGEGDTLIVEDLLESFPESAADLQTLKGRVLANPLYRDQLISANADFTTVVVRASAIPAALAEGDILAGFNETNVATKETQTNQFLSDAQSFELVSVVKDIVEEYKGDGLEIFIAGSPVVTHALKQTIMKDMRKFLLLALLAIGIFLFLMFRRPSGVFIPLLIVVLSLLSTLGLMGHMGVAIKVPTQILPSFLLAVSVGAAVHVLAIFYYRLHHGDDKRQGMIFSLSHSGLPIMMTSLTTAAGLASFSASAVAPIADLGMFAALGVMISFFYTSIFLPIMISFLPIKAEAKAEESQRHNRLDRLLTGIGRFATKRAKPIVIFSALLTAISLYLAVQIPFSHNPLLWLPESMDVRQSTTTIDHHLNGSVVMEIVVDTGKENGLHDPDLLNRLDQMRGELEEYQTETIRVGKAWSIADVIKETNRALNENRDSHYTIPQNQALISQELLLFENSGSDDLEDFVDSQFSQARFSVKTPWVDATSFSTFITDTEKRLNEVFHDAVNIEMTGIMALLGRTLHAALMSMQQSYITAVVVIGGMMMILLGSLRMGALAMIPNLFPIIVVLGLMGLLGWPMDLFTMLIGAIALGLAVDDTVHFMYNFRRYHHNHADVELAVEHTMLTTGRAMLVTTIVLSVGFFIFMFSSMSNLFNFGVLTGAAILLALISDFLLAPALMTLVSEKVLPNAEDE